MRRSDQCRGDNARAALLKDIEIPVLTINIPRDGNIVINAIKSRQKLKWRRRAGRERDDRHAVDDVVGVPLVAGTRPVAAPELDPMLAEVPDHDPFVDEPDVNLDINEFCVASASSTVNSGRTKSICHAD